jgi:hypothetical protein
LIIALGQNSDSWLELAVAEVPSVGMLATSFNSSRKIVEMAPDQFMGIWRLSKPVIQEQLFCLFKVTAVDDNPTPVIVHVLFQFVAYLLSLGWEHKFQGGLTAKGHLHDGKQREILLCHYGYYVLRMREVC